MSRLLNANMVRLAKSRIFLLAELFMAGYAVAAYVSACSALESRKSGENWNLYFFNGLLAIGIVMAVFVSVFLHAQYSDHTIRNKIMVGHRRSHIYLADYLTCLGAGWLMCATYHLTGLLAGLLLIGSEMLEISNFVLGMACSAVIVMVYTALFVLVEMLDQNKARSMSVNVVAALALLAVGMQCFNKLISLGESAGWLLRVLEKTVPFVTAVYVTTGNDRLSAAALICLSVEAVLLVIIGISAFQKTDIE